jgi:hypothetical protein
MSIPLRKLGLGGGGMKGILQVGALLELSKHQKLYFPEGVYGCSIGSILATYISFELPFERSLELTQKYLSFDKIIPKLKFEDITNVFSSKGMFEMDVFEKNVIDMFNDAGLDISEKKIGDAKMPLYIVSSNITRGVPTVFSRDVRIIDALKCSCCLPGVFKPCEMYEQLYIDGCVFTPCLSAIVPDALVLSLPAQRSIKITAKSLESLSPIDYLKEIYSIAINRLHNDIKNTNTLCLSYPGLSSTSDLSDFDVPVVLEHGGKLLRDFLLSKSTDEESPKSS